jgi:hypothetical protein
MSRHRKRPAPRHGRPRPPSARARILRAGIRRLVVTPTFAAALGVVAAAVLAYPVTRTVISYGGTPPVGGHRCPVQGCLALGGGGAGKPALANPGTRLAPPRPSSPRPSRTKSHSTAPAVHYQTVRQWQGGFVEQVTISPPPGPAPVNWHLLLSYGSKPITDAWPGTWKLEGTHAILVDSGGFAGKRSEPGRIQVYLEVSGPPGPPAECSFDGQTCHTE